MQKTRVYEKKENDCVVSLHLFKHTSYFTVLRKIHTCTDLLDGVEELGEDDRHVAEWTRATCRKGMERANSGDVI